MSGEDHPSSTRRRRVTFTVAETDNSRCARSSADAAPASPPPHRRTSCPRARPSASSTSGSSSPTRAHDPPTPAPATPLAVDNAAPVRHRKRPPLPNRGARLGQGTARRRHRRRRFDREPTAVKASARGSSGMQVRPPSTAAMSPVSDYADPRWTSAAGEPAAQSWAVWVKSANDNLGVTPPCALIQRAHRS